MELKKRVLLVSQYFPPDVTAASFRIVETANILKEDGFQIEILTAYPHKSEKRFNHIENNLKVTRVPILRLAGSGIKDYFLHYVSFMFTSILIGIIKTRSRYDFIIASSPPLCVAFSGWVLSIVKRSKFILDIRDIWPDSVIATRHFNSNSIYYRFAKFFEYFIYKKADLITCISEKMKDYIKSKTNERTSIFVLYNGLYKKFFNSFQLKKVGVLLEDKFIISYIGNVGYAQNLNLLLDVAESLKDNNIKFNLVGDGTIKKYLKFKVNESGLKNIDFIEPCSKIESISYMLNSHALLVILNTNYNAFNLTIPSKVFDYLWANKPILFGIEGEGRDILTSLPGNLYFNATSAKSLLESIIKLKENYNCYSLMSKMNRKFALNSYSREELTRKFEEYLLKISLNSKMTNHP